MIHVTYRCRRILERMVTHKTIKANAAAPAQMTSITGVYSR